MIFPAACGCGSTLSLCTSECFHFGLGRSKEAVSFGRMVLSFRGGGGLREVWSFRWRFIWGLGLWGGVMGQVFQKFQHRSRHLVFQIAAVFSYSKNEFTRNMCLGEKMAFLELCLFVPCVLLNQAFCVGGGWKLKSRKLKNFPKAQAIFSKTQLSLQIGFRTMV